MLGKKRSTFSRDDFIEKELRRSGAFGSYAVAYSTVKALDEYATSIQYKDIDDYLLEIKAELKEEPDSDIPMRMLDDFASHLTKIGRMPATVKAIHWQGQKVHETGSFN